MFHQLGQFQSASGAAGGFQHAPCKTCLDQIEKYTVEVKFADDLSTDIKVWVSPDAESKAAIDAFAKNKAAATTPAAE